MLARFAAKGEKRNKRAYVGQNNLLWDLGMDVKDLDDMEKVKAKVAEVKERFDLVMITERWDESLVLLADVMCWSLEEVVYLKQNERFEELRNVPTDETKEIMRTWLRGDYYLYEFFMTELDKKVDAYGRERMRADVERLRDLVDAAADRCVKKKKTNNKEKKTGLDAVYTFEVVAGRPECGPLTWRETDYCKKIRENQNRRVDELKLKGLVL